MTEESNLGEKVLGRPTTGSKTLLRPDVIFKPSRLKMNSFRIRRNRQQLKEVHAFLHLSRIYEEMQFNKRVQRFYTNQKKVRG